MKKALLRALLEPTDQLGQLELAGDYTARFALLEEQKSLPWQAPTANAVMCQLARIG
jgi:L-rhamnose isomerase